ncbi:zinc finger protein ZFP2-like [Anopheles bellator]|uniref:zinc finger protein ZFP2-like n=1 Tax=Anopheles bellator TaxID=139047 RepID=UPI00264740E9|nr:zinc finger protein ZFP2-like [Anopheles bellator]
MSPTYAKIENICRLCLSGDDTLESIFGDSGSDSLQTIIYDCTSIRIQRNMGFPSSICGACKTRIESFYQFRERCKHNDEYLRSTLLPLDRAQDEEEEADDEDEVVIKMEPEVLLEERSDIDPREAKDEHEIETFDAHGMILVDGNDNKIDLLPGQEIEGELDRWEESASNGNDSNDASSNESLSLQPDVYLSVPELNYVAPLKCEYCSQEFSVLEQLKLHITSHKEERIFQCYYCPKTFHFAKNLNMHVEYIHSKAKYSHPPLSVWQRHQPLLYSSSSNNSSVSQSTNGDALSPLPQLDSTDCLNNNTIPSSIGVNLSLNINLNGRTTGNEGSTLGHNLKPIRLPAVPAGATPSEISVPMQRSTSSSGQECHVCHKSFNDSTALRQHMLVHAGEKPYKCDICSKSFYNASTLKTHQRIHSDQNPYRCATCTKMFDNARSLELHHRTHTGEKPYACDVCLKKFSCSSNLKRHRKLHDRY